ncbi:MAG: hypothetical protein NVSMB14_12000 [Isosphaeraceae bacterium]
MTPIFAVRLRRRLKISCMTAVLLSFGFSLPFAPRLLPARRALAQAQATDPGVAPATWKRLDVPPTVTVCGILAVPGREDVDPRLKRIAGRLRKLYPHHGFRLLAVTSRGLSIDQPLYCKLDVSRIARVTLEDPADADGKLRLLLSLDEAERSRLRVRVSLPPSQLVPLEHKLPDRSILLLSLAAR